MKNICIPNWTQFILRVFLFFFFWHLYHISDCQRCFPSGNFNKHGLLYRQSTYAYRAYEPDWYLELSLRLKLSLSEDISLCFVTFRLQKACREMRIKMFMLQISGAFRCFGIWFRQWEDCLTWLSYLCIESIHSFFLFKSSLFKPSWSTMF